MRDNIALRFLGSLVVYEAQAVADVMRRQHSPAVADDFRVARRHLESVDFTVARADDRAAGRT